MSAFAAFDGTGWKLLGVIVVVVIVVVVVFEVIDIRQELDWKMTDSLSFLGEE